MNGFGIGSIQIESSIPSNSGSIKANIKEQNEFPFPKQTELSKCVCLLIRENKKSNKIKLCTQAHICCILYYTHFHVRYQKRV